jgi:hypothetical protein
MSDDEILSNPMVKGLFSCAWTQKEKSNIAKE